MAQVYSARLIEESSVFLGPFDVYTTPAGVRTVVKSISIVWGDVAASGLDAGVQTAAGGYLVRRTVSILATPPDLLGGTAQWFGSWVLEAGEHLFVIASTGTADINASGYELSLP